MEVNDLSICRSCSVKPKTHVCGLCDAGLCKKCSEFLEESTFSFYEEIPADLKHTVYCVPCFEGTVLPAKEEYDQILEDAKEVAVFFTTQKKKIPLIKRSREMLKVEECKDRDEAILRIAFFAAELEMNALVDVEVVSEKVRNEGYQKMKWRCQGFPAMVDLAKMERYEPA